MTPALACRIFCVDTGRWCGMKTRVQKWGNSLAIRIPRSLASELRVVKDSPVDLSFSRGRLIVRPVSDDVPSLDELLEGITDDNRHEETDWGPSMGAEAW